MRKDPRVWVAAVVVASLAVGGAYAFAAGARGPTNSIAARVASKRILTALLLPAGATRSQRDPSGSSLSRPATRPVTPNLVDLHEFWRVPGDPLAVLDWITAHAPTGSRMAMRGAGGVNGMVTSRYVGFSFGGFRTEWPSETLLVTLTAAHGGGTAVRADGQVVWLFERPPAERIPSGVGAVTISEHRINGTSHGPWTVTDQARVRRIVALLDRLPAAQPGAVACPADLGPLVTATFSTAGGRRLATAYADGGGCGFVNLWIRGHRNPALQGGPGLIKRIGSLLGASLR
jgi:hypothetical protein